MEPITKTEKVIDKIFAAYMILAGILLLVTYYLPTHLMQQIIGWYLVGGMIAFLLAVYIQDWI